jgi:hypothetical protein
VGLAMEDVGIFNGALAYFLAMYMVGIFYEYLVYLYIFGIL